MVGRATCKIRRVEYMETDMYFNITVFVASPFGWLCVVDQEGKVVNVVLSKSKPDLKCKPHTNWIIARAIDLPMYKASNGYNQQ